jgi:hypothetical protein
MEEPILCAKAIREQFIRYLHSIQMDHRLGLKDMSISALIDGAKRSGKNLCLLATHSAHKLHFIDLLNLEGSAHWMVTRNVAPTIQELSIYSIRVDCIRVLYQDG